MLKAGLLTYSLLLRLPVYKQWQRLQKLLELTAAGTVEDSHLIPYYFQKLETNNETNVEQIIE